MQNKPVNKKSALVLKQASGKNLNKSKNSVKDHAGIGPKTGGVTADCSAILVVETKNERMRTIKEYEKQRDAIRSALNNPHKTIHRDR